MTEPVTKQSGAVAKQQRAEQTATCIRLRSLGLSQQAIGEQVGLSQPTVGRLLREAPKNTLEAAVTDAAAVQRDWRAECHAAIDRARACLEPQLARGNPQAVMALLRSVAEVARLEGLNVEVHGEIPVTTIIVDSLMVTPGIVVDRRYIDVDDIEDEPGPEPPPAPRRSTPRTTAAPPTPTAPVARQVPSIMRQPPPRDWPADQESPGSRTDRPLPGGGGATQW